MQYIQDADREWEPEEEGDELIGVVTDIGWDQETDEKAANIQPKGKTHLVRVWPRYKRFGRRWDEAGVEQGNRVRIRYLGERETWKESSADEGQTYPDYKVEVLER